jgi:enamine deaminase RidA (YjgF/YER057c/UK114 family)
MKEGVLSRGVIPSQVSVEEGAAAARQAALNGLAVLAEAAGGLDKVRRIVRVGVFVCSDAGFTEQPKVANGASEFLQQVFGEAGRHARAAVGNIALPLGACVEVELLAEVA